MNYQYHMRTNTDEIILHLSFNHKINDKKMISKKLELQKFLDIKLKISPKEQYNNFRFNCT